MYLSKVLLLAALSAATVVVAAPGASSPETDGMSLFARAGCSKDRNKEDECTGKKIKPMNSFHNCKSKEDGKCCAKNSDGTEGINVKDGQGREDCGYCFTGKCKKT